MQILIDKDRDNFNNKLKEEHDQRRIEQMELVQRLDNNERCGKSDITVCIVVSLFYLDRTNNYVLCARKRLENCSAYWAYVKIFTYVTVSLKKAIVRYHFCQ